MKYNFKFLQTGGVPLTNDLMALIEEAYGIFEVIGGMAGSKTILTGCETVGSFVNPGIVAIDDKLYSFEGGSVNATVYIHTKNIEKTFEDQNPKTLIEEKTVKFGSGTGTNNYNWSEFVKLETLKELQIKLNNTASQPDVSALAERVAMLELKTAPIVNGGIVWAWFKPKNDIPVGWKECIDIRGKTIVGLDPNDSDFVTLKSTLGEKKHKLTVDEMPSHSHYTTAGREKVGTGNQNGASANGGSGSNFSNGASGGNQSHNNIQPSIVAYFIEPNFQ